MIVLLVLILLVLYLLPVYRSPKVLKGFLSPEERQHIIKEASGRLSDSLVDTNGIVDKEVRQSHTAWLQKTDPIVRSVMERCVGHVNKTIDHCEQLQVLRYVEGGHYKPHQDAFKGDENSRLYTFILALTDDYEGGETEFPNVRKSYKLNAGDALFFHTLDSYGLDTSKALHGGKPVKSGEKWICNLWIRQLIYNPK
jgi:predicted 2-oxoglutarate/Fe(II)-dependent dioxygenase YbiX